MTMPAMHERAEQLRSSRTPFVHARVVLAERPTSAKPGDEALVLADGVIEGFVGGDCAESTVRTQGLSLLQSGDSMLLRISPNAEADQPGKTVVHNPCLSGGTLEIFLEPVLPVPLVSVVGDSPIARAMATVATALGYEVKQYDSADLGVADAVLVASHGKNEDEVLVHAVRAGAPYVGLIASPRRGHAVVESLDLTKEERERIHTPAGLDIGARTAGEVAISVFAQIIAERPRGPRAPRLDLPTAGVDLGVSPAESTTAVDPVCGMTVTVDSEALSADASGGLHYFCCAGCRREYLKDPEKYPRT